MYSGGLQEIVTEPLIVPDRGDKILQIIVLRPHRRDHHSRSTSSPVTFQHSHCFHFYWTLNPSRLGTLAEKHAAPFGVVM